MNTPLFERFADLRPQKSEFIYLAASLLVLLVVSGFLEDSGIGHIIFYVLLSLTLLASIYAISHSRRFLVVGIVLAILTFANSWIAELIDSRLFELSAAAVSFIYFVYAALVILMRLFRARDVTINELAAAISTYLLMGIAGAFMFMFMFMELLNPDVIVNVVDRGAIEGEATSPISEYIYFSFTCLTMLGFGDLVPVSPQARVIAYLEAVTGQIFLTVLIARLVGLHISRSRMG